MVWLLFLHIASLVIWTAALCILLILLARKAPNWPQVAGNGDSLERIWFTRLASPAGLFSIVSGTLIFAVQQRFDSWLLLKLTLVTALVACHVTAGLLILYRKRPESSNISGKCTALLLLVLLLIFSIVVLVLLKPQQAQLPWFI